MMGNDGRSENEALITDAPKESSWSFRSIAILVSLCVSFALECGTVSLLNPFLPTEAQERGVSLSVVGIIFSCFPFAACVFAPIWGKLIARYGAHRILVGGLVLSSACVFLFAICKLLTTAVSFALTALVLRSISAIGAAACETSAMSIALGEFPHNLALVTGVLETSAGVGYGLSPALGGFLYTAGGFQLPFFVFGFIMAAVVPIFVALYKKQLQEPETGDKEEKEDNSSILEAIQIPGVFVIALCYVTAGTAYSVTGPILAPYLVPVGIDAFHVGLTFLCYSVCYGGLAPVIGFIGDKMQCYRVMIVVGLIGTGVSFLLLGPAPFLSFILPTRKFWLICVVMALNGALVAVIFVSLMPELKETARNYGMADNESTNGIISGIFTCTTNLGATIGPLLGGILYQHIGFQWTTTIEGFYCICQGLIVVAFVTIEKLVERKKSAEDIKEETKLIRYGTWQGTNDK